MIEKVSGVYWIRNKVNNHIYIGSSKDLHKRKILHKSDLRLNTSTHTLLQKAVNEFGLKNFSFRVLITCHPDMLEWYEQQFIDQWKPEYNTFSNVNGLGHKVSEETLKKLSESHKGHKPSEGTRKKLSEVSKGRNIGRKASEETRRKLSESHMGNQSGKGHKHSEELKRKWSEARKGTKLSEETKRKMSEAQKKRFAAQRQSTDE